MFLAAGLTLLQSHVHLFQHGWKNRTGFFSNQNFPLSQEAQISAKLVKLDLYHLEIPQSNTGSKWAPEPRRIRAQTWRNF